MKKMCRKSIIHSNRKKKKDNVEFLLRVLSNNTDIVFCIYNLSFHKNEYVSCNVERFLGISEEELYQDPYAFLHYADIEEEISFRNIFESAFVAKEKTEREFYIKNPVTKEEKWINCILNPVFNSNGEATHYVISINDLTTVKQTQENLENVLQSVQKANLAKTEFLSNISHEIRTPMNAINGMTAIAKLNIDQKEKVLECLEKILQSSVHLQRIINDVLDLSAIESGKFLIERRSFYLPEVINDVKAIILPAIHEKRQNFKIDIPQLSYEHLVGDSLRLNQILINILSNANKYTDRGGNISLKIRETFLNDIVQLKFIVSDTGYGMNDEFLDHLFEPFIQEKRKDFKRYGSTGIGMAITKNLVELMNGIINVSSELGEGTTFAVELPFGIYHREEVKKSGSNEDFKIPDFSGKRILLAEDNEINAEIVLELLKKTNAGSDLAHDGEEAVRMFLKKPDGYYNIILMDIQMPNKNGYEAAKMIRQQMSLYAETIPIVAMTANAFKDDVYKALDAGMNEHISKPVDMKLFYRTLEKYFYKREDKTDDNNKE